MPYLTPDDLPEERDCRALFIPASSDWLAIVSGALTELVQVWNWEQGGAVTVDEAIAAMQEMIDAYYTGCASGECELPEGGRIIRISPSGHPEMLEDGAWVEPTGDYVIPPPETRTEGTETDQICLAAKNAVHVLDLLYEELAEMWAGEIAEAEALTAITIWLAGILGAWAGFISLAILAFVTLMFKLLYAGLEYLGADLWTEDFSKQLECFLVDCATNDAGVVTFDWDCVVGNLNSLADGFGLSELQLRLYLQVSYMLWMIGGVDGLNAAGGTTAITSGECDCVDGWCEVFYPDDNLETHWTVTVGTIIGNQVFGVDTGGGQYQIEITMTAPADIAVSGVNATYGTGLTNDTYIVDDSVPVQVWLYEDQNGAQAIRASAFIASGTPMRLELLQTGGNIVLDYIYLSSDIGANPFGDDNCP